MKKILSLTLIAVFFASSCATTVRKAPDFTAQAKKIKVIAVMPPDVTVYQLTAGGVQEEIDEWSETARKLISASLKKYLAQPYGFEIKFIDEDWLKENYKELWNDNRALYEAVATSVVLHAYPNSLHKFPDKVKAFDYTLGANLTELAKVCDADTLLFVQGFDNEATAGRNALLVWNVMMGVATGVMIIPTNPSLLVMGLVNGTSGNVEWFKTSPGDSEYSFRNEKNVDTLIKWFMKNFIKE